MRRHSGKTSVWNGKSTRTQAGALLGAACLLLATAGEAVPAQAQKSVTVGAEARSTLDLTIYNRDLGLVQESRQVAFQQGGNLIRLTDVSPSLQAETLSLEGEGLRLVEQSFLFDLLSPRRLLEESVGKTVWLVRSHPQTGEDLLVEAELLSVTNGVLLKVGDRIETAEAGRIAFRDLPAGLPEKPTLEARLESASAGERPLSLQYLTGGLTWQADYRAALNADEDRLDLTGLVTLTNTSGIGYPDARLRLVAGEVNQGPKAAPQYRGTAMMAEAAAPAPGMPAQQAGDQHLYQVPHPVSLSDRETKQVVLLESAQVPVTKEFRFEELVTAQGGPEEIGPVSAAVVLRFDNDAKAGGPGKPLPAGTVRVYGPVGYDDGSSIFLGEDRIGHTPDGEEVKLAIAKAFDVTGRSRVTAFERLSNKSYESAQEITIANAKDEAVQVKVVGQFPAGWRMLEESAAHEAEAANRVVWTLEVPAGGETKLTYRVRVTRP